MAQITTLPEFIEEENVAGFLHAYLKLILEGYTLSIPTKTSLQDLEEAWEQVLSRITADFSEEFLSKLSEYWQALIQKQQGQFDENFFQSLIDMIEKKEGKETLRKMLADEHDELYPSWAPQRPGKVVQGVPEEKLHHHSDHQLDLSEIQPSISQKYYETQSNSQEKSSLSTDKHNELIQKALKQDDVDHFLIYYLGSIQGKSKRSFPKMSSSQLIQSTWEALVMTQFHHMPSDHFIKALCNRWHFLITQFGIPSQNHEIQDMVYYLMNHYQKITLPSSDSRVGVDETPIWKEKNHDATSDNHVFIFGFCYPKWVGEKSAPHPPSHVDSHRCHKLR